MFRECFSVWDYFPWERALVFPVISHHKMLLESSWIPGAKISFAWCPASRKRRFVYQKTSVEPPLSFFCLPHIPLSLLPMPMLLVRTGKPGDSRQRCESRRALILIGLSNIYIKCENQKKLPDTVNTSILFNTPWIITHNVLVSYITAVKSCGDSTGCMQRLGL